MTELLGLVYSPWTEKARWALDVRRVPYTFKHYQPLVGEPALRLKLRRPTGRVSVPVLTDDDGRAHADSLDIARWADLRGEGPRIFPPEHERAIAVWAALSERALNAGRALSLTRMLEDEEALAEMVPRPMRKVLGKRAAAIGAAGVRRTLRKYGGEDDSAAAHRSSLASVLDTLRESLSRAPEAAPKTILGRFTFADIAVSQALAFVEPPKSGLKLGAASRKSFTDPELRDRCSDLLAWRDALYERYRGVSPPP